ncbi:hypothetical protein K3495_g12759 [Podosphaera aphanis]|nr:hypothetical protein K3495_g12759 [Podosphaera aphanis]
MTIQDHARNISPSTRVSPFRRPESLPSPSPLRQSTPELSPSKMASITITPSRLGRSSTPVIEAMSTPSWSSQSLLNTSRTESSPSRVTSAGSQFSGLVTRNTMDGNALSKLQPSQVRELRECFQILDRDSDGHVGKEDVLDMLTQLGLSTNASDVSVFFPPTASQTITLPAYLNSLSDILGSLSPPAELLSAFSAYDEDDSGQIDPFELKNAILNSAPDSGVKPLTENELESIMLGFTGRRAFAKQARGGLGKRGEVFRYQEFVASVTGGLSIDGKDDREKHIQCSEVSCIRRPGT